MITQPPISQRTDTICPSPTFFPPMESREGDSGLDGLDGEGGPGAEDEGVGDKGTDEAPIVRFVNKMLIDAMKKGASDIHFEPYETDFRVRFRTDGVLRTVAHAPIKLNTRIAARLTVMAQLNIAEKREIGRAHV